MLLLRRGTPALRRGLARRALQALRRDAQDRQAAADEELAHLVEGEVAARPVPVPDAVVQAEHGARQQARIGLRDRALLHAAGEERRPRELQVTRPGPSALPGLLLARGRAMDGQQRLLGDQHAVAQDLVVAEVEAGPEDRD